MKIPISSDTCYIYALRYSNSEEYHYVGVTKNPDTRLK
ncbi:MAG: GIY-YIG nuclease family protein, partial [Candidatus Kariarchaeaceae archaeon]